MRYLKKKEREKANIVLHGYLQEMKSFCIRLGESTLQVLKYVYEIMNYWFCISLLCCRRTCLDGAWFYWYDTFLSFSVQSTTMGKKSKLTLICDSMICAVTLGCVIRRRLGSLWGPNHTSMIWCPDQADNSISAASCWLNFVFVIFWQLYESIPNIFRKSCEKKRYSKRVFCSLKCLSIWLLILFVFQVLDLQIMVLGENDQKCTMGGQGMQEDHKAEDHLISRVCVLFFKI